MPERCSRELEGRKHEKDVVIRSSRLMIDDDLWSPQNPAYRCTISFFLTTNEPTDDHIAGDWFGDGLLCGVGLQGIDFAAWLCATVYQTHADGIALWAFPCGHASDRLFCGESVRFVLRAICPMDSLGAIRVDRRQDDLRLAQGRG